MGRVWRGRAPGGRGADSVSNGRRKWRGSSRRGILEEATCGMKVHVDVLAGQTVDDVYQRVQWKARVE